MTTHFYRIGLTAAIAVIANGAAADDAESLKLGKMVVSATGIEQKITEAPASISVITQEDLKTRPFTSILDAVKFQEGVDIGTSRDKTGQGSVSMRGLSGDYTLVLIDGKRQNNHGDIYPNNFGGNQFNHVPPLDAIERVEVIRGPASTLYGADALGGVINIITKKHTDNWTGSVNVAGTAQTNDNFGDDKTLDFNVMGPLIDNKLSLGLRSRIYESEASSPEFESVVDPAGAVHSRSIGFGSGGRTVDSTNKEYGLSLIFTPSESHTIRMDYDNSRQVYDNTPIKDPVTGAIAYPLGTKDNIESVWRAPGGKIQPRVGYSEEQEFTREWWSISHDAIWEIGTSTISLAYVDTANEGRTLPFSVAERALLQTMYDGTGAYAGLTEAERRDIAEATFLPRHQRTLASSQYTLDARLDIPLTDLAGDHLLVVGTQIIDGEMEDSVFGMETGQSGGVQDQEMYSLFVEDNWMPTEALTVTAGVRYDDHDVFGDQVSPRLYGVYALNPSWTLKGGVSTGYKTPKTTDLYDGITGFGGQGTSPFAGNPDLQPETSVNSEIALYWEHPAARHNFNITYFQTDFDDKISRGDAVPSCGTSGGVRPCVNLGAYDSLGYTTYRQKINVDKVEIQGVELAGSYQITTNWSLRGNYTWTDSEQKSGPEKGQPLADTAEHMANLTLDWQAFTAFNLFLQSELRSDRFRGWDIVSDEPLYYKNYKVLNLGMRWQVNERVTVNGRVNNLLDESFVSYQTRFTDNGDGTWMPSYTDDYNMKDKARNFWVGVNVAF